MFDYLSKSLDRHPGNLMMDPGTGAVQGLGNDLSFGATFAGE